MEEEEDPITNPATTIEEAADIGEGGEVEVMAGIATVAISLTAAVGRAITAVGGEGETGITTPIPEIGSTTTPPRGAWIPRPPC